MRYDDERTGVLLEKTKVLASREEEGEAVALAELFSSVKEPGIRKRMEQETIRCMNEFVDRDSKASTTARTTKYLIRFVRSEVCEKLPKGVVKNATKLLEALRALRKVPEERGFERKWPTKYQKPAIIKRVPLPPEAKIKAMR